MGQVIPIMAVKDPHHCTSSDPVEKMVYACYEKLSSDPSFRFREGQRTLSIDIARALIARVPIAAEAPTGTGKTIAYLVAAIVASKFLEVSKEMPVVVATATVGLQQQIMTGDLPRFYAAGLLSKSKSLLAKGRSRYFCIANAERQLSGNDGRQEDFFDEEARQKAIAAGDVQFMLDHWYGRTWNGDFDSWTGALSEHADTVRASADTCISQKCEHYASCPFFAARRQLAESTLIVANHDLVISDLAMSLGDQEPLFPSHKYIVVFDEAHHLPDKALEFGAETLKVTDGLASFPKLHAYEKAWGKNHELGKILKKAYIDPSQFDPASILSGLQAIKGICESIPVEADTHTMRFLDGLLPEPLRIAVKNTLGSLYLVYDAMQEATKGLKKSELAQKSAELRILNNELLFMGAAINKDIKEAINSLETLVKPTGAGVKWLYRNDGRISLHASPLEGSSVLAELMWKNDRVIPAMVSATLQDFDGFDRYRDKLGVGGNLHTSSLPHIFPYEENTLGVVLMDNSPKFEERADFERELVEVLPKFIDEQEGSLVLLPSKRLQAILVPVLKRAFPGKVLVQGELGIKELLARHRTAIDNKDGSILCGLATLAEGLDLPGDYCTHVLICALPFQAPTSPVERELQEKMGREYFEKKAMPDVLVKLVQMCGRLMRRETDRGRITFFDKRLIRTRWGLKLLEALPPYKRRTYAPNMPPLRAVRSAPKLEMSE